MFYYGYLISIALRFVVPAAVAVGAFLLMRYWAGRVMACGACRAPVGELQSLRCANCNADLREVGVVRRGAAVCWATAIVIAIWMMFWPIVAGPTMFRAMNAVPQIGTHTPQTNLGRPLSGGYADGVVSANVRLRSGWFGRPGQIIRQEWNATFQDRNGVTVASVTVDLRESTVVFDDGEGRTKKDGPLTAEEFTDWLGRALPNVHDPYWLREQAEEIIARADVWMAIEWNAAAARQRHQQAVDDTIRQFELSTSHRHPQWRMGAASWSMIMFKPTVSRELVFYGYHVIGLLLAIIILLVGRRLLRRQAKADESKRGGAERMA